MGEIPRAVWLHRLAPAFSYRLESRAPEARERHGVAEGYPKEGKGRGNHDYQRLPSGVARSVRLPGIHAWPGRYLDRQLHPRTPAGRRPRCRPHLGQRHARHHRGRGDPGGLHRARDPRRHRLRRRTRGLLHRHSARHGRHHEQPGARSRPVRRGGHRYCYGPRCNLRYARRHPVLRHRHHQPRLAGYGLEMAREGRYPQALPRRYGPALDLAHHLCSWAATP